MPAQCSDGRATPRPIMRVAIPADYQQAQQRHRVSRRRPLSPEPAQEPDCVSGAMGGAARAVWIAGAVRHRLRRRPLPQATEEGVRVTESSASRPAAHPGSAAQGGHRVVRHGSVSWLTHPPSGTARVETESNAFGAMPVTLPEGDPVPNEATPAKPARRRARDVHGRRSLSEARRAPDLRQTRSWWTLTARSRARFPSAS